MASSASVGRGVGLSVVMRALPGYGARYERFRILSTKIFVDMKSGRETPRLVLSAIGGRELMSDDTQQRNDCQACTMVGLKAVGISPTPNASVDFGAINSDDLCIALA